MERLFKRYSKYKILRIESDQDEGLQEKVLERIKYRNQMIFLWVTCQNIQIIIEVFWVINGQIADFYCLLDGNKINDIKDVHNFSRELIMLTNLKKFSLSLINMNNKIDDFEDLFENISLLSKLEDLQLDFRGNKISQKSHQNICKLFQKLNNLKHLDLLLSYSGVNNNNLQSLGSSFSQMNHLESIQIDISRNIFNSLGLQNFFISFTQNKFQNLQEIEILCDNNQLNELNSIKYFSNVINTFKSLSRIKLSLSECNIQDQELADFVSLIQANQNIRFFDLDLSFNNLSNQRFYQIHQILSQLLNLQKLNLKLSLKQGQKDTQVDLLKFCRILLEVGYLTQINIDLEQIQEFLFNPRGYLTTISIKASSIYVEDNNLEKKETTEQLNNTLKLNPKSGQSILSNDKLEVLNQDLNQKKEEDEENQEKNVPSKQFSKLNTDQEILNTSENVQQIDESDEFDSKKRQYTEEFFKYVKVEKYSNEIQIKEFILNIIKRNLLSIDRLIVYFKLRQQNKYQIEDAQNYGVDYTLYQLSTNTQDENLDAQTQKHQHSVYLLKIGGALNMWLGYARIAHNVNKVMIIAQISYNNKQENYLCSFDQIIKDWFQQKNIKMERENQSQNIKPKEEEFEIQINKLVELFNLDLISFGVSKDN
ncbi:tRNA intron endonuclease, catalytic carboxy-terminal domain protein (macronuclear) [Tetrahymena thermophila SB210]|uniref:tRNA intron endonuclease, catalytic carboxy-terminal domain protein n=1 Tax=Tetrahymena thermophila (strain SB210) TaxID=312017 RepID=I7MJL7_TETTS|nr:tRNA intron endonuclease, catalytic carboxy-terminal domain protein [Tetrahymena thermophila SB210]EAS06756.2 tRNA intron endonuclease, catalytic carboxy-terminal domain protein [Tetrahymena thermophila SB210]|eukprot:XP_001026998.2 tRNA intron endonuclease, catalytic carboxy-terminal domain protein [Tetrahymena thermophila SB210]